MDFAKLMSAQIAKSSKPSGTGASATPKFQKRADAEAAREAAYRAEQGALAAERQARADKKRKAEEEDAAAQRERDAKRRRLAEQSRLRQQEEDEQAERARRERLGLPADEPGPERDGPATDAAVAAEDDEDVRAQLRAQGEPAVLFGETAARRRQRLAALALRTGGNADDPIPTSLASVAAAESALGDDVPPASDAAGRERLARQLTTWFNGVLRAWAIALAGRDAATAGTFAGQAAAASRAQAVAHLRPLFRKLERLAGEPGALPDDLLVPIAGIVRKAQRRRYVAANDDYLQLSIGKAAWPIGVTMVGIHERSAREKLHESDKNKAHIMSDESTRKILQSIKRCLSFAQTKWPPEDVDQLMG